jgi:hypothetical protein
VVTCVDGKQYEGELLAVRQGSLFLLDWAGNGQTVDSADIQTVRIVRKSHAGILALGGLAAGAVAGVLISRQWEDENIDFGPLFTGAVVGGMGALAGLALSIPVGLDTKFAVAGEPAELVKGRLDRLARYSREFRILAPPGPAEIRSEPVQPKAPVIPSAPSPAPSRPARRPRFKITLSGTLSPDERHSQKQPEGLSFGFPGDGPQEDAGPHPLVYSQYFQAGMNWLGVAGPYSLSYEWTEHWSTEIELFPTGWAPAQTDSTTLRFTSAIDGRTYWTDIYHQYWVSSDSLLLGLNYRLAAPTPFNRHIFEIGVAAGAARVRSSEFAYLPFFPADRKVVLSGRVQAAYDFYFIPAFSLGACIGYRHLEASFPATTVTTDLEFVEEGVPSYQAIRFTRATEAPIAERTFTRSTFYLAIRAGFRF